MTIGGEPAMLARRPGNRLRPSASVCLAQNGHAAMTDFESVLQGKAADIEEHAAG
jgi:hypothetical protein